MEDNIWERLRTFSVPMMASTFGFLYGMAHGIDADVTLQETLLVLGTPVVYGAGMYAYLKGKAAYNHGLKMQKELAEEKNLEGLVDSWAARKDRLKATARMGLSGALYGGTVSVGTIGVAGLSGFLGGMYLNYMN